MAITLFKSFRSTVTPFIPRNWFPALRLLVDPTTGAPTGIQNPNDNGADGIWTPIDLTAAQVASPAPAMLADINAVYRLNVAPYTRYYSTGALLVAFSGLTVQGPSGLNGNIIVYSPLVVSDPAGLVVEGTIHVINFPA
jgi:hypothetical protein